uniref:SLC12 domain-containing protein n=2 Tax=Ascaris TaxID=6251 RepID=A0A0M3I6M3_ASCLU
MTWSDIFAGWRVNLACYILRWVEAHMDTINYWYPKILILHLDENKEWLVDCQKLIAVAEWIKEGVIINIVALLCEGRIQDPDTPQYLRTVDDAVRKMIGESCLNAHQLVVSYEKLDELNETASAVIQCSGLGILNPNTIILEFPKCGKAANFVNPGQGELWSCIASTVDKYLIICKGDLWKPVPSSLTSTMDLWWIVEDDNYILSFVYLISRSNRWTFTKLRIFALIKENEMAIAKDNVKKRIHNAKLYADSIDFKAMPIDDLCAYGSAEPKSANRSSAASHSLRSERSHTSIPLIDTTISPTLNNIIRVNSANADLILVNLPRARMETSASRLLISLEMISDHLPRMIAFRPPIRKNA